MRKRKSKRLSTRLTKLLQPRRNRVAQSYCMNKGYKIYPIVVKDGYKIEIEYKGQIKQGTIVYKKDEWSDAIWILYEKIYEKNRM